MLFLGECSVLVNCAAACIERSNSDFTKINYCLRHQCAFHCFDGTCPKCSAFVTRIFNQICVSGKLRKRVPNFNVSLNLTFLWEAFFEVSMLRIFFEEFTDFLEIFERFDLFFIL